MQTSLSPTRKTQRVLDPHKCFHAAANLGAIPGQIRSLCVHVVIAAYPVCARIVLSEVTICLQPSTRTLVNASMHMHTRVLCPCGTRLESHDALIDHQDWFLGTRNANARLFEELRRRRQG